MGCSYRNSSNRPKSISLKKLVTVLNKVMCVVCCSKKKLQNIQTTTDERLIYDHASYSVIGNFIGLRSKYTLENIKSLGIIIHEWKPHINVISSKIFKPASVFIKLGQFFPYNTLCTLYNLLVYTSISLIPFSCRFLHVLITYPTFRSTLKKKL